MIFFAHDIGTWLGAPTALVIVAMVLIRKKIRERRAAGRNGATKPAGLDARVRGQR